MSIFTDIDPSRWVAHNELAFAIRDGFPVAPGHTLVIPKREVPDWFEATPEERAAIFELVDQLKAELDREFSPAGYNVGMNCGEAAGQTVMHLHVHIIPRYVGDMPDPRGGVRHVIPWKGNYKVARPAPLARGGDDPFHAHLRPLFASATQIDILAAFVQDSGITLIEQELVSAVEREASVRILCSDYLHITQEAAVRRLYDLQSAYEGRIQARIAQSWETSFHPKSWQFITPEGGSIFVGSSNLSYAALSEGIEWNLRLDRHLDPEGFALARDSFEHLWLEAKALDLEFVRDYQERARAELALPPGEVAPEIPQPTIVPHPIQERVLAALQQARQEGHRRALVTMATGLGKTWLAAFDVAQFGAGRTPRVLFVAHRSEILTQAANTFRRLFPDARTAWFVGDQSNLDGDLVFASIQKIARPEGMQRVLAEKFDYVVVDEVHHAAADSYQRLLQEIDPGFLLGLTATPERGDGLDILGLFNDYVVDEVGIAEGIEIGRLVPFKYTGIADTIDFAPIPWRAGRFDAATLAEAAQTQARMTQLWDVLESRERLRTLAFCCTIEHAVFVRDWFREKGLKAAAVVSGPESDDRAWSLNALASGELDVVCAVDILNEGVDIPAVDRVVFLRPTESKVIFLQQLGRGLRVAPDKSHLEVLDFVGNHKIFAERLRWLLNVQDPPPKLSQVLDDGHLTLPSGCEISLSFEAKNLLKELLRARDRNVVVAAYRRHKEALGTRPTALELYREGIVFGTIRSRGGWVGLVHEEGDSGMDQRTFESVSAWLQELETTAMTKSFKLVSILALLEEDALFTGLSHAELAKRSLKIIQRSPELLADIKGVKMVGESRGIEASDWLAYWKKNPIAAWANSKFVSTDDETFKIRWQLDADDHVEAVERLVRELVTLRLAQYRARRRNLFFGKITHNERHPIIMIPRKDDVPSGEIVVQIDDGESWVFRFAKIAVNVAHPVGGKTNMLPELLYAWFGPTAGENQTFQKVRFEKSGDKWFARPVGITQNAQPDLDDELVPYLDALKDATNFQRRIAKVMLTLRGAQEDDVSRYIEGSLSEAKT